LRWSISRRDAVGPAAQSTIYHSLHERAKGFVSKQTQKEMIGREQGHSQLKSSKVAWAPLWTVGSPQG